MLVAMNDAVQPTERAVPQDLQARQFDHEYVVATTRDEEGARAAANALEASGFSADEIIVVSDRVDTLRLGDDDHVLEVDHPERTARGLGRVAGGLSGAGFGAAIGLAAMYVGTAASSLFSIGVVVGGLIGAVAGVLIGQWMASRLSRRPAHMFDALTRDGSILVGVGFAKGAEASRIQAATSALRGLQLNPRTLGPA
jgi:uncharacterized SAM-binding protein YcdF (DUF218 family)